MSKVYILTQTEEDSGWPEIVGVYNSRELAEEVGRRLLAEHTELGTKPRMLPDYSISAHEVSESDDPLTTRVISHWAASVTAAGDIRRQPHQTICLWRTEIDGPTEQSRTYGHPVNFANGWSVVSGEEALRLARQALAEYKPIDNPHDKT